MMIDGDALDLKGELRNYGLTSNSIRLFNDLESPELLDYLDLMKRRNPSDPQEILPDGVAESQGHPLLFFVDERRLFLSTEERESKLKLLRHTLACRGEHIYLARISPGELSVMPVNLLDRTKDWKSYSAKSPDSITFFSRLSQGYFDGPGEPDETDFVFNEMLNLLKQGSDRLAQLLGRTNVLSLIGRSLFFRFLCDRKIIAEPDTKRIAPKATELAECFDNSVNAYDTSQWLDRTFNGDFLPLEDGGSTSFFDNISDNSKRDSTSVFSHLSAIVRGWKPVGKLDYQIKLQWSDFNFAHVPIGLLSQVYEAFCWRWDRSDAKETSVYYTPRKIAALLVDEAFDGLPNADAARVLDPACGAGVFLIQTHYI